MATLLQAPASSVADQVGAFAKAPGGPRPALAPADPAVVSRIKAWAVEAISGTIIALSSFLI